MSKLVKILAREVLDSRGNPTVEVEVKTKSGAVGRAIVPSGASTGENEALELRDGDSTRFGGKGVLRAVNNVNTIIKKNLIGKDVLNQKEIDNFLIKLDGTENKSILGANAILGVSMAVCRAGANFKNQELFEYLGGKKAKTLPLPMFNVFNGGQHADNCVDFQEYMIVPVGAKTFKNAIQIASEVFNSLKIILKNKKLSTNVGDEGGFAPNVKNNEEPLKLICSAIEKAGYVKGKDVAIALDVAASGFYNFKTKKYNLIKSGEGEKTTSELIKYFQKLVVKYPIISLEDPLSENDKQGFVDITQMLGDKIQIVGDDLFVTNVKFLLDGINQKQANSVLIKLNQIGTVSQTLDAIKLAQKNKFNIIISHRSGETEDTFIADLSVAVNAEEIKSGSICRGERICKYNQLIRIEEKLAKRCKLFSYNFKKSY